jgi:cytochrome c553
LPSCARCKWMRASVAVLLLLPYIFAVVAARAADENIGVTLPPPLASGQAPLLPKPDAMAEPLSSNQVGFPTVLTDYVFSPATLRAARVALGQKLFLEPRLSGNSTLACATCHDPDSRLHQRQARVSRHPRPRRPTQREITLLARDDGRYANSLLKSWFDRLASGKGLCCSFADGFRVDDVDWDTQDGHYRVRLNGDWIVVPDNAVVTEPNKYGQAVVWPYMSGDGTTQIRCFMPGTGA